MKLLKKDSPQLLTSARMLHDPVLPRVSERLCRLLNAPHIVYWGAEHRTLDDWRDAEQQLKENRK